MPLKVAQTQENMATPQKISCKSGISQILKGKNFYKNDLSTIFLNNLFLCKMTEHFSLLFDILLFWG